ncbi:hypothetical protein FLAPXU55_00015 [Flavobacterium panici]|uniref:Uncharacterized protein n=1 Tax=Flavobacterium panici TaxID=2654843 RepID=A0A9N8IXH9_9FLAO|nr:hypothetical protein FLAPXU55_00015 [Flavobacterium panici]
MTRLWGKVFASFVSFRPKGEICVRSSTKIGDLVYGATCADPSFLGMTRLGAKINLTTTFVILSEVEGHARSSTKIV